jgi:hypothetical protein
MTPFHITVNGRLFRISPAGVVVDCRDVRARMESQAIVEADVAGDRSRILADSQVRDAIASAYYNATARESGRYPVGGTALPDDFNITPA